MREKNSIASSSIASAALAVLLCLGSALPCAAQGDLTGGVGVLAIQPKREKSVSTAKPRPPVVRHGPKATKNDRLLEAASKGDAATTADLLKEGADANAKSDEGCAALVYAVAGADKTAARELIAKGADVNARCEGGWTPLLWACWMSQADVVRLLLEKGADVNARDKDNDTALMKAATQKIAFPGQAQRRAGEEQFQRDLAIVRMLIEKGADVKARGNNGGTALLFAASREGD